MTSTDLPHVPLAAVDQTASRALAVARDRLTDARASVRQALDVDWVSSAATAYGGEVTRALGGIDDAGRLLGLALDTARRAEDVARRGLPPACLAPVGLP